jgi:uncharacterized protein (TIGR03437 family)
MKRNNLFAIFAVLACTGGVLWGQVLPNPIPDRVLGRLPRAPFTLPEGRSSSPNLVEGRELWEPQGVAVDTSRTPPAVFVADTLNNRVLAWRDATGFWNGAFADAVLGQRDRVSTLPRVPEPAFPGGLNNPLSVAVDAQGRVFVLDAGNNRILRFRNPFDEQEPGKLELIIGQTQRLGRCANQDVQPNGACVTAAASSSGPDASKLRTSAAYLGGTLVSAITFDPEGNLWVADAGNHRLLRYPREAAAGASNITPAGGISPVIQADRVIGQLDMTSATANRGRLNMPGNEFPDRLRTDLIRFPGALAFDSQGRLYVADDLGRVLYYGLPAANGQPATRLLGIVVLTQPGQLPPSTPINDISFGATVRDNIFAGGPRGLFTINDRLFVVDTLLHRILQFDPPERWPVITEQFSPRAQAVWGQDDFTQGNANIQPYREPTSRSFHTPAGAVFANNEVWVADSRNHRVLVFPNLLEAGPRAEARGVLGQESFEFRAPNFIQGREFSAANFDGLSFAPHAAIDYTSDPPRLYIADPGNNRVLGFADARSVQPGDYADVVIGQVDFYRQLANSPFNDPDQPTEFGLLAPTAVAVDREGNLWVADAGNGRVVRFPRPFDDRENRWQRIDLVIGQPSAETRWSPDAQQGRLARPVSIAFTSQGQLLVADVAHHRVLRYDPPFFTGMDASVVIGQLDFTSALPGSGAAQLALPYSIALDSDDRLYVADAGNNRVQIFDRVSGLTANAPLAAPVNFRVGSGATAMQPVAVAVDQFSGRIWVVDSRNGRVRQFQNYFNLLAQPTITDFWAFTPVLPSPVFQMTLMRDGALLLGGLDSRLTVHPPGIWTEGPNNQLLMGSVNAASGFFSVTPGGLSTLRAPGVTFSESRIENSGTPVPRDTNDYELLVNGRPAPILRMDGSQIRYIMPWEAPVGEPVEFRIRRISTGETAAYQFQALDPASPAFLTTLNFQVGSTPARQIRATNQNGSENGGGNPATAGSEVTLFLTGGGPLEPPPPDGEAAERTVPIDGTLIVGGREAQVLSSTLDPNEPGVWRIRAKLPDNLFGSAAQSFAVPVVLIHKSRPNNRDPLTGNVAFTTTLAIRQ